jgi:hypothetical protein
MYSYDAARARKAVYVEHYWDEEFVGAQFYRELVENYYISSTFVFVEMDAGIIKRFLSTDVFGLDFPPSQLVRSVEVRLSSVSHDRASCTGYMFGVETASETMLGALEGVEEVKRRARVVVRLETRGRDEGSRRVQVERGCGALVPRLREVRKGGRRVRLEVDGVEVDLGDEKWVDTRELEGV